MLSYAFVILFNFSIFLNVYSIYRIVVYQGPNQTNQDLIKAWLKHEEPNSTKGRTRQQEEVVNQIPSSSPSEYSLTSKPFSQNGWLQLRQRNT